MKLKLYADSIQNLKLSIRVLLYSCIFLSLMAVFFAFMFLKASEKTRVVLIPPKLVDTVVVGDEYVDRQYLILMSRYAIDLLTNVTPETVDKQMVALLSMVAPESYAKVKSYLAKLAKVIKSQRIVQAFAVQKFSVTTLKKEVKLPTGKKIIASPPKGKVYAEGILLRRISASEPLSRENVRITINYIVRLGQFQIVGIKYKVWD